MHTTPPHDRTGRARWLDAARVRRIRLSCGLILFVFVGTHLLNHALGLISLQAMEAARGWFIAVWRNPVGSVLLVLVQRRLPLAVADGSRPLLGLETPLLLRVLLVGVEGGPDGVAQCGLQGLTGAKPLVELRELVGLQPLEALLEMLGHGPFVQIGVLGGGEWSGAKWG